MREVGVTAFPYATQYGTIEIPDDIKEDQVRGYIDDHWSEIKFGAVDLDYAGTDFDIEDE